MIVPTCSPRSAAVMPARDQAVHDLHVLDVARVCHHLDQRAVDRQRAFMLGEVGGAGLAKQLRLLPAGAIGVGGVHPVDVLDDGQAGRAERVGEQERAGVGAVRRDARARELVVVIGRKGAAHHRAGGGEVDRELVGDGRVLDIGDALRRQQRREDMAVLAGLAGGERGERADRQAEIEADAVEVAGADAGAGQDQQAVLGQELAELVDDRAGSLRRRDP